jgi:ATP-dependent DNA helicase RecG
MAPTEVLATQHATTLENIFSRLENPPRVVLLTGSTSRKDRDAALKLIESGEGHVVIGTHSLISDDVVFKSLGLAVVDEQHRFGVEQRAALASKGEFLFIPVWSTSLTMCFVYRARGRYGSAG